MRITFKLYNELLIYTKEDALSREKLGPGEPPGFRERCQIFISDLMWWYFLATPLSFLHVFNEAVPQGSYLEDNDLFHRLLGAHKYPVPQTFPCMLFLIRILLRQT
jgi:hypothetical protein